MAAYAALVSVMQILDQIQVSSPPPISIDNSQLQSLTQKLAFLQEFLEGYSSHVGDTEEADPMECRIADAAYAAEDVIESYIVDQILARSTNHDEEISSIEFYQSLQTVIEKMELIEVEIEEKKGARDQLHTIKSATHAGSSVRAAPEAPITVGFDDVLLQMLDKITGGRPDRQIIPIVGMGGIDAEDTVVLRNLHTLSTVTNLICGEEVVCRMPNIKKLKLSYDGSMEASPGLNNLRHLHKLETLTIDIDASPGLNNLRHLHKLETLTIDIDASCDFPCRLVHNISFPHSLKWLTLERTELQWEDVNTKIGSLPLLQVLKLGMYAVIGFKWKTLEGQFRSLKFLRISRLCDLEKWETDNTHFPRLQHLVLRYMIRLREIPLSMGDIPTLRLIELKCCIAAEDSAKRILEEQEELGNTDLEVFITNLKGLDFRTGSFTLRQIKAATNNFDPANKIEEGGFGPVYKGVLLDGQVIAVKQLSSKSKQGNREFINEIGMISALQHPHLVKLYGCCIEGNQLLLVHEYCQNNSLARALFGPEAYQLHLDWATRHTICIGIARGLAYLHEESRIKIIHRDIYTRNVLLDENLVPKICNFGLAKLDEEDNTTYIAGTFGYMAPEYAMYGYLTDKADVYSFGVVLLEIVSGKEQNFYLIDWANSLKAKGSLLELVDPRLELKFNKEEVTRSINVALLCTNAKAVERPSMSAVVSMLEGRVGVQKFVSDSSISIDKTKPEEISRDGEGQSFSVDVPWSGSSASASAPNLYPVALDTSYWEKRGM